MAVGRVAKWVRGPPFRHGFTPVLRRAIRSNFIMETKAACPCGKNDWTWMPDSLAQFCPCGFVRVWNGPNDWTPGATIQQWASDLAKANERKCECGGEYIWVTEDYALTWKCKRIDATIARIPKES